MNFRNCTLFCLVACAFLTYDVQCSHKTCLDANWCNIAMPLYSLFRFNFPPDNITRWNIAKQQAASGDHILLERIVKHFPNYLDFINGESRFRDYHTIIDFFVDEIRDLTPLTKRVTNYPTPKKSPYSWERTKEKKKVLPEIYNFCQFDRALVLKIGYFAFTRSKKTADFGGPEVGKALVPLSTFLNHWKAVKDKIDIPFVALDIHDENWGLLSTYFPNRTGDWGQDFNMHGDSKTIEKQRSELQLLHEFLDHNKTLMLVINQHSNVSHPKIVTVPLGLPIFKQHGRQIVFDIMRYLLRSTSQLSSTYSTTISSNIEQRQRYNQQHSGDIIKQYLKPKSQLVFTSSSRYGHRPNILACIHSKFKAVNQSEDFQGINYADGVNLKGRINNLWDYYLRLGTARMSIAMPGVGYDTFRLWESLTLGTVPVVEKGVGLDKVLWRLPALLVEDFDQVTPELLRTAYVEALYRADEFEFERLKQSYWWSFIMNVTTTKSTQTVFDKFPLHSDDANFMRPFVPFACWETNSCGKGTKRIPKTVC